MWSNIMVIVFWKKNNVNCHIVKLSGFTSSHSFLLLTQCGIYFVKFFQIVLNEVIWNGIFSMSQSANNT